MRVLPALMLAAALAGCLGGPAGPGPPGATPDAPEDPARVGAPEDPAASDTPSLDGPVELVSATLPWHENDENGTWYRITQHVASGCLFGYNGAPSEPYSNNLPLSQRTQVLPLPAGTRGLEVTLDWGELDYPGDALVLAYREGREWRTSGYLPRGTSVVDVQDTAGPMPADLWLCLRTQEDSEFDGDPDHYVPRTFVGEVTVTIRALGTDA